MNIDQLMAPGGDLEMVVSSVFETMMGVSVVPTEGEWNSDTARVTATISLTGYSSGVLMLEADRLQACQFAGHFLQMDPPDAVDNDVRDVLGELANMISGNIKSALMPEAALSLPSVIDGSSYNLHVCNEESIQRKAFACDYGVFWVNWVVAALDHQKVLQAN